MLTHPAENHTRVHLHSTELTDRTVWFDGRSSFNPERLLDVIQLYDIEYVDFMTDVVRDFNKQVSKGQELKVKTTCEPWSLDWVLPEEYLTLDVVDWVATKHAELAIKFPQDEIIAREIRLAHELHLYHKRNLLNVLRTTIFVINTLTAHNAVWGVGRGSSVSSYVLYVIGIHDVDSFAYDLDIDDFLHD